MDVLRGEEEAQTRGIAHYYELVSALRRHGCGSSPSHMWDVSSLSPVLSSVPGALLGYNTYFLKEILHKNVIKKSTVDA